MDVETIVPGHGPITEKQGVAEVKGYLEYIFDEARKRYEAGLPAIEAARDIPLDHYASWKDGERIAVNVVSIYRELSGDQAHPDAVVRADGSAVKLNELFSSLPEESSPARTSWHASMHSWMDDSAFKTIFSKTSPSYL